MKTVEELRAGNSITMLRSRPAPIKSELRPTQIPQIRVAIIDPEPFLSLALQAQFELDGSSAVIVDARSGLGEAVNLVSEHIPDLLIIEADTDWKGAVVAIRAIRDEYPQVKVVAIARSLTKNQFSHLMGLGIAGCLSRLMGIMDFVNALALISAGALIISPMLAATLATPDEVEVEPLTDSEYRLLNLIAEGRTNCELTRTLCISEATLKRQIRKLLLKLHVENRVQAAVLAIRERLL